MNISKKISLEFRKNHSIAELLGERDNFIKQIEYGKFSIDWDDVNISRDLLSIEELIQNRSVLSKSLDQHVNHLLDKLYQTYAQVFGV